MTDELKEEHFEEKPFLEHLEDLRMTLLKIIVTTAVAAGLCLILSQQILSALKYPMDMAGVVYEPYQPTPPAKASEPKSPKEVTNASPPNSPEGKTQPGTHIVVTGPFGRLVVLAWDLFNYSKKALVSLKESAHEVGNVPPKKQPGSTASSAKADKKQPRRAKKSAPPTVHLMVTGPVKGFMLVMNLALWCGVGIAMPLNLFFLAQFIFPALTRKEKKYVTPTFLVGGFLFVLGILFGYFLVIPLGLYALASLNAKYGLENFWEMDKYLSTIVKLLLANGAAFEVPLLLTVLVRLGVVSVSTLGKKRKHALVLILFASAILTPTGDALTMTLVAIPMYVLYEGSIWASRILMRKQRKREKEQEEKESYWEERKRIRRARKVEPEKKEEKPAPPEQPTQPQGSSPPPPEQPAQPQDATSPPGEQPEGEAPQEGPPEQSTPGPDDSGGQPPPSEDQTPEQTNDDRRHWDD